MLYTAALLIGVVAGLRAMTVPTAVSFAAYFGWIDLSGTWLAFLGFTYTPWIFAVATIGELVSDKLPGTPSRKVPPQFGARIVMGGFGGAAIGAAAGHWLPGLGLGVVGAAIGTFGGAAGRARLARAFGRDLQAALVEDVVALVAAFVIVKYLV